MLGRVHGHDILDVGCGAGFYTRLLLEAGAAHVCAVDESAAMAEELPRERVTVITADAATVTLPRCFSRIVCAGLLEFVSDPVALLANLRRSAAENATLVLLVPTANAWGGGYQAFHRRHGLAVRLFTLDAMERMAASAGWRAAALRVVWPSGIVAQLSPAR